MLVRVMVCWVVGVMSLCPSIYLKHLRVEIPYSILSLHFWLQFNETFYKDLEAFCQARHESLPFCVLILLWYPSFISNSAYTTEWNIETLTESILHFAWLQRIFGILIKHIIWHFYYQNLDKGILVGTQCSSTAMHQLLKILKIFSVIHWMRGNEKGEFHTAQGMGLKPTKINAIFLYFLHSRCQASNC